MTASVTGCSTCSRVFISKKYGSPWPSTTNSTVPALTYPTASAAATAASVRRARSSGVTTGEGASSTIFWWRRWMLHSRSNSATVSP